MTESRPAKRKRRSSPRYPAPTIRQFASRVGTTESIIRAMVRKGQLATVDCNGRKLIPPREEERWRQIFGGDVAATSGTGA